MAKVARKSSSNEKAGIWLEAMLTYLYEILCGSEKKKNLSLAVEGRKKNLKQ